MTFFGEATFSPLIWWSEERRSQVECHAFQQSPLNSLIRNFVVFFMCKSVHVFLLILSLFFDSSVFSVPQDESSSDRGGHHSDNESLDTPPPKPPRIRR